MLVVVLITKFTHGAWLVVIAMPAIFLLMKAIARHYRTVARELTPEPGGMVLPARIHAVVLVSRLHRPTLRALAYARATRPDTLTALTVASSPEEVGALRAEWAERGIPVPLTVLDAPYRDITGAGAGVRGRVARVRVPVVQRDGLTPRRPGVTGGSRRRHRRDHRRPRRRAGHHRHGRRRSLPHPRRDAASASGVPCPRARSARRPTAAPAGQVRGPARATETHYGAPAKLHSGEPAGASRPITWSTRA